ncbi:MAG: DUF3046 domain-containing protein [Arcanobacterium sp.]|nr:DUF3046 domain-containing protein [Arcanobacterium sp.]
MKHTEFWAALDYAFPEGRGRALSADLVLPGLESQTAQEALDNGVPPLRVWHEIISEMQLPQDFIYLHRKLERKD